MTEAGRAHWQQARQARVDYLARTFEQLAPEEIAAFETVFLAFQRILDQADAEEKAAGGRP